MAEQKKVLFIVEAMGGGVFTYKGVYAMAHLLPEGPSAVQSDGGSIAGC